MAFEAPYGNLSEAHPEWGTIAILPWDTELFGFAVADYRLDSYPTTTLEEQRWRGAMLDYASKHAVELIMCSVPNEKRPAFALLSAAGFVFFDYTLAVSLSGLQVRKIPAPPIPVRDAQPGDQPEVERIAEQAFRYGRYHADPYIPGDLANRRYRDWVRNAFASADQNNRIFVTGSVDTVHGFMHVRLDGHTAHITIMAVDEPFQRGATAFSLAAGSLRRLRAAGIREIASKISAANLGIMNMTASFGCRYADPQAVFYWHASQTGQLNMPGALDRTGGTAPE